MLLRVCQEHDGRRWLVLICGQTYGEYLDKNDALLDAIEAAKEACEAGGAAEVWEGAVRLY